MMIEHSIFARSNAILSNLQYHLSRFSKNSARLRWWSKQILFDHMCLCSIIWSEIGLMNDPDVIKHETIVYKYLTLYYGDEAIQRISWGDMINIFYSRALLLISLYKSCLQWNILITATKWYWKSWLSEIQVKLRMLSKSGGAPKGYDFRFPLQ